MKNKVIQGKITKDSVKITIQKDFLINNFEEVLGDVRVKKNRKNKFLEEFIEGFIRQVEYYDLLNEVYEKQTDENIKYIED